MKIVTTPRELMDLGLWERDCGALGLHPSLVDAGMMDADEPLPVSWTAARYLGLVPRGMPRPDGRVVHRLDGDPGNNDLPSLGLRPLPEGEGGE